MRVLAAVLAMAFLAGCGQAGPAATILPPTPVPTAAPTVAVAPAPSGTATPIGVVAAIEALTDQTAVACGETSYQIGQSVLIVRDQLATKGLVYPNGTAFQGFAATTLAAVLRLHRSTGMTCPQAFVAVMDQTLQAAGQQ